MADIARAFEPDWLSGQVLLAEREAFSAIDRFAQAPSQATIFKTILTSMLDRGVCRMALELPILVDTGIRGTPGLSVHALAGALTLLEAGIYTLDHIIDLEVDGPLVEIPRSELLIGAVSLISHLPHQIILDLPEAPEHVVRLTKILADGVARIGAGQLEDVAGQERGLSESRMIERAVAMKTGERRALFTTMAAVLAGATQAQIEDYAAYGRALGTARQLRSDLVDLFGASPSRDLASGVLTLPLALYLEVADEQHRKEMERLLAGPQVSRSTQRAICDRLREAGIMREVAARIERLCRQALERLAAAQPIEHVTERLRGIVLSASVLVQP